MVRPVTDSVSGGIAHGERLLELLGYIKLTCCLKEAHDYESYIFFPEQFGYKDRMTDEQAGFLIENYDDMTIFQKRYAMQ